MRAVHFRLIDETAFNPAVLNLNNLNFANLNNFSLLLLLFDVIERVLAMSNFVGLV